MNKVNVSPFVSIQLTGLDHDGHGRLLDDGANPGEGGKAAVVSPAVLLLGVGEVQVSVQTHGHPLVLLDVLQTWMDAGGGEAAQDKDVVLQCCRAGCCSSQCRLIGDHDPNSQIFIKFHYIKKDFQYFLRELTYRHPVDL